jgi:hypothetical protein
MESKQGGGEVSCFFCDGPKVASVRNIQHRDYFAAPIGTMTMVRGYDGEPTVKVEIDTDVEIYGGLTANVTASCHIERIRYCMFCGKKIVND